VAGRGRSNPLALAVLSSLQERPMHPYEVAQTLRTRAKHLSIRLNYGSLYSVVEGMERRGLIAARETVKDGRRPERTIYEITEAGRREMAEWLSDLVAVPEKEFLQFEAALTLISSLAPEEAVGLLREREDALRHELAQRHALSVEGLPRLYLLEHDYVTALLEAEVAFVARLIRDIELGELDGIDEWRAFHRAAPEDGGQP
jgi:DNA-binding PadR family transcriptional regulator